MFRTIFENVKQFLSEEIFKAATKAEIEKRQLTRAETLAKEFRRSVVRNSKKLADGTYELTMDLNMGEHEDVTSFAALGLPISRVIGDINLYYSGFRSLEGGPRYVKGNYQLGNSIHSFRGAPIEVTGNFYCGGGHDTKSLEGCPKRVGGVS